MASFESKKTQLDALDKTLVQKNILVNNTTLLLGEAKNKQKGLLKLIKLEREEHRKWLSETKRKANEELSKTTGRIDDLEEQKKDLKVVEKRLKKIWEQTTALPFPAL